MKYMLVIILNFIIAALVISYFPLSVTELAQACMCSALFALFNC